MRFTLDQWLSKLPAPEWYNPIWLPFFRIVGSLLFLFQFLAMAPDFYHFWGDQGLVYPDIQDARADWISPTLYDIHQVLLPYVQLSYNSLLFAVAFAYCSALVFLAAGLYTRAAAFVSWSLHLILFQSIHLFLYGADYMATIALFYMILFPVGKIYSVDAWRKKQPLYTWFNTRYYVRLLQTHFGIAYFFSGLAKGLGPTWWNGEAMWKALQSYDQSGLFNPDYWATFPLLLTIVGISTVFIEVLYPLGVAIRPLRNYFLAGIILLHTSIALLMGLYFFSAIMIVMNVAAFWYPYQPQNSMRPLASTVSNRLTEI